MTSLKYSYFKIHTFKNLKYLSIGNDYIIKKKKIVLKVRRNFRKKIF